MMVPTMDSSPIRILRPSRGKLVFMLLLSIALTACGVWVVLAGQVMGSLLAFFCGVGVLVFVAKLLPGCSYLQLDEQGLTFCELFRPHFYCWSDVGPFEVGVVNGRRMVVFNFSAGYSESPRLRAAASSMTGHEGALVDSYRHSPEALAELLNEYRETFAAGPVG